MSVGSAMRTMGRSAREKAETMSQDMKERTLEKRLDRAESESERLRFENDLLRDEVTETRSEHRRILDLLESRLDEMTTDVETNGKRSHKGRWLLFLMALGGGAYYWFKQRSGNEWVGGMNDVPTVTESGTTVL
jgi:hypothetical protein